MTDQALATVSNYFGNEIIRSRFAEILGERNVGAYISSVLLAVANNEDLQKCDAKSIYTSALRAASLRLSVDPAPKQAYLVPFGKQATLIVGAKGLYDMAIRTGRYRRIDVYKMFEGESIEEDRITGTFKIVGGKKSDRVTGWLGVFEMTREFGGISHVLYMSVDEIHEHAKRYSKGYNNPKGAWRTNPEAMEHKTILRLLISRWGYLDPTDAAVLDELEENQPEESQDEVVEGVVVEKERRPEVDVISELGYDVPAPAPVWTMDSARFIKTPNGTEFGLLMPDQLEAIVSSKQKNVTDEQRSAAQFLLDNWK